MIFMQNVNEHASVVDLIISEKGAYVAQAGFKLVLRVSDPPASTSWDGT